MSLYNLYRPRDWDSVIGQEYITTILRNGLKTGRVHHAYLFHGSRGTGKTTSARILAKALNCLDQKNGNPCHECSSCKAFDNDTLLDIVEIDAASNTWVDNIRELIERARFEPNQAEYKIYIIDEVHMLSTGAFNALLKTLEQPPSHVKFILATTEIEKVPETIRSRTLRFDFRKIGLEDIVKRLEYVCKEERIKAEDEALHIIAKSARGWLRDALTLLEQNIMDGEVSSEHVRYTLALVEDSMIDACIEALEWWDVAKIQELIAILREKHVEARAFFEQLMYRLRDHMITHIQDTLFFTYSEILDMLESAYGRIRSIPDAMMLIEITLLRIVKRERWDISHANLKKSETEKKTLPIEPQKKEQKNIKDTSSIISSNTEDSEIGKGNHPPKISEWEKDTQNRVTIPEDFGTLSSKNIVLSEEESPSFSYPTLIHHLKATEPALMMDLKSARFQVDGTTLILSFGKKWNYDRVNTPKIKNIIAEKISLLFIETWKIECKFIEWSSGLKDAVHEVF